MDSGTIFFEFLMLTSFLFLFFFVNCSRLQIYKLCRRAVSVLLAVTFVYCVETAKDVVIVTIEVE